MKRPYFASYACWSSRIATSLCFVLLWFAPAGLRATTESTNLILHPDSRVDGEGWVEDIDILEQAYKSMHAGLYRYNSPAEVDLMFDHLHDRFRGGTTLAEAFVALTEFGAAIRCGHTYPNFYNQDKEVVEALFKGTNRLPFEFVWLGDRMVITRNLSANDSLGPGAEVEKINGKPVSEILARLMKLARADGANDAKRRALLQVQGANRYEPFDIYYALCFPLKTPQFVLTVRPFASRVPVEAAMDPLPYADRLKRFGADTNKRGNTEAAWALTFPNPQVARLRMPTWALYNSKWDWNLFLDQTFTNLAEHPGISLVIDLRDNEGGLTEVGNVLLQHLIRHDIPAVGNRRFVRYRNAPKDLVSHLDTWDWSFLDRGTNAIDPAYNPTGNAVYYRLSDENSNSGKVLSPRPPLFKGKVIVLMNSENSSATFQFEEQARRNHVAALIGQPSGGNQRGINGGSFFFLHLPNSKIEIDLPLIAYLPAEPMPDAGISPDKIVHTTPQGLAEGRDETWEAALKFLHAE